jgi:hypothetical protein
MTPSEKDWVVIPEVFIPHLDRVDPLPGNRVLFCQNHFYLFDALPVGGSLRDMGFGEVLSSSTVITQCLHSVFGIEGTYVPCSLDHQLFKPSDEPPRIQVAFMPRRGNLHVRMAMTIIKNRNPDLCVVPWVAIDGFSEQETADILRSSAVYLATGYREGLGLPSLEAMACGCIVVGFKAGGGKEYATNLNGMWVPDEDGFALAVYLEDCLVKLLDDYNDPGLSRIRQEAKKTAGRYSRNSQKETLIKFWKDKL